MGRGWLIVIWTTVGAIVGQLLGIVLAAQMPQLSILQTSLPLGVAPTQVDLGFMLLYLGVQFKLSLAGAAGMVVGLWISLRTM